MEFKEKLNKVFNYEHQDKHLDYKGCLMFEDDWLSAFNFVKCADTKEVFKVEKSMIFEHYIMEGSHAITLTQRIIKRSVLKLDKPTNGILFIGFNKYLPQ